MFKNKPLKEKPIDHLFLAQNENFIKEKLNEWRDEKLPRTCNIIHTIPSFERFDGPLFSKKAEDVFKSWDVISTTLIDGSKIIDMKSAHAKNITNRQTGMFFEIAFKLKVPCQNILGTFEHDVWFPNHAGRIGSRPNGRVFDPSALFESIRTGERKKKADGSCFPAVAGGFNQIVSPQQILRNSNMRKHNEILIIGRPGVNIYKGLPVTGKVQVTGIVIVPKYLPGDMKNNRAFHNKWGIVKETLESINPGVKCRFY